MASPSERTSPKSDVRRDPVACSEAKAQLKELTAELAEGCAEDNPCIIDHDCLVRTAGADASLVREARMSVETACTPAGEISRPSCVESPVPCEAGRCVRSAKR